MRRSWRALALAAAFVAGCDSTHASSGDPIQSTVVPPAVEQVHLEPDTIDWVETVRIGLKNPLPLPATQADTYVQSKGKVDILFVMSNAGSMALERVALAGNFQDFFNILVSEQADFRVGVISTDQDNGAILVGTDGGTPIIDNTTANASQIFLQNVTMPPGRVSWVQALNMMQLALSGVNPGFLRDDAALAIIAVSNSDDESFGGVPYFARYLKGVKQQGYENWTTFSTIAGDLPSGCEPANQSQFYGSEASPAPRLIQMAHTTGGVVGSICDPSFETTLASIAGALNTLRRTFPLSILPDIGTITVTVNGEVIPEDPSQGWTYVPSNNSIEFLGSYVPPPGADIEIEYAIGSQ